MLSTIRGVALIVGESKLGLIAAGVAFFAMLAVFPAIAALIALWGYVYDTAVIQRQIALLAEFLPHSAFQVLDTQVQALIAANDNTLGLTSILSTLLALWSARSGVAALIRGLNAIHGTRERSGLMHVAAALLLTLVLTGMALVALTLVIVLPIILALFPLGPFSSLAAIAVQWACALAVVVLGIGLVYRYGPNRDPDLRTGWFSPGTILAVALWVAASVGFSTYISNFGSYNRIYGPIGAGIALMMWMYLSAYVILLGAALNAELEARHP